MRAKMGLLRITPIVVLILQLYEARGDLPMLLDNRLLAGDAKDLPGAKLIDCQPPPATSDFKRKKTFNPSEALTDSNFEKYAFTSHALVPSNLMHDGGVGVFSVIKVQHGLFGIRTAYILQQNGPDNPGNSAYWLPQGGFIDIPKEPTATDPKYVFTADYSGCSWTVTPTNNGTLRLRHVEYGREDQQFNDFSDEEKGGPITYAMQYKDYGYIHKHGKLIEHVTAYAYMKYSNKRWTLYVQHQTCAPSLENYVYKNGQFESLKMNYCNQGDYTDITGTEFFSTPSTSE